MSRFSALVSFDLFKQKNFNYEQMYVALSRVRSLYGQTFIAKTIKADPIAIQECE